jgi:hypothetical protein
VLWIILGGIWGLSIVALIMMLTTAEHHCVCVCTHARCRREITGDDLLCDWCRNLRGQDIPHCHMRGAGKCAV